MYDPIFPDPCPGIRRTDRQDTPIGVCPCLSGPSDRLPSGQIRKCPVLSVSVRLSALAEVAGGITGNTRHP